MRFNIILEPAEEGGFNVIVPALDGCYTQGENQQDALDNAREAIVCYIEGLEKLNEIKSRPKAILIRNPFIQDLSEVQPEQQG
jgi:predicted RNase H-like HicB family nuclease